MFISGKKTKITKWRSEPTSQGFLQEKQPTTGPLCTSASSLRTEGKLCVRQTTQNISIPNRLPSVSANTVFRIQHSCPLVNSCNKRQDRFPKSGHTLPAGIHVAFGCLLWDAGQETFSPSVKFSCLSTTSSLFIAWVFLTVKLIFWALLSAAHHQRGG